jgi:hypothetical protein
MLYFIPIIVIIAIALLLFISDDESTKNTYDDNDYFNEFYKRK